MPRRNFGVAIELPETFGAELRAWRERFGDPVAKLVPPHVTLLPPTWVREVDVTLVDNHLRGVVRDEPPFRILLRGTGTFLPVSPVTFVQLAAGISDCERLERKVRSGPLERKVRFNYHPHVTVVQDVPDEALDEAFRVLAGFEAEFVVDALTLFEEGDDKVWRPLQAFPLTGG